MWMRGCVCGTSHSRRQALRAKLSGAPDPGMYSAEQHKACRVLDAQYWSEKGDDQSFTEEGGLVVGGWVLARDVLERGGGGIGWDPPPPRVPLWAEQF